MRSVRLLRAAPATALLVVLGLAAGGQAQSPAGDPTRIPTRPTADALLARAVELHQAGDYLGAVASYEEALAQQPDNAGAHSNLGAALVQLGRHDLGLQHYRRALELEPQNPAFRFNLALALYKVGDAPHAAEELTRVLALRKDDLRARLLLGDSYLRMGRFQDVVDVLAPWQEEFGDDKAFGYVLGSALVETDRADYAQLLLDRIFKDGESAEAHLVMATAHLRANDTAAALAELGKAAALNPSLPAVNALMGRALLRNGDQEGALRAFQRELTLNPNDFQANLEVAELKKRDQAFDDAKIYVERALRMRPDDPGARFSMAGIHVSLGEPEPARVLLEDVVADAPNYTEAYVLLATVYYRLQRKEDGDRMRKVVERLNAEAQQRNLLKQP
jgi:tetratricopeptide (TPR) repeat protein